MSHQPERKEKNCLNCGSIVAGRFCQTCGQENVEVRESFWSLTKHFVYDILHFDGKFFHTLRYLFTKPGFAAKEYVNGRRASFLHPIRMYLFTSAIFFLLFFATRSFNIGAYDPTMNLSTEDRVELAEVYQRRIKNKPSDSIYKKRIAILLDTVGRPVVTYDSLPGVRPMSVISFNDQDYRTVAEYDSAQKALPKADRDGWFARRLTLQGIAVNSKYKGREGNQAFLEQLLHKLPYLLFVSLPFFAGLLKLLYVRRKAFLYSDHAVFTLYHYVFSFILLAVVFLLEQLNSWTDWQIFEWIAIGLGLSWPVYLYLNMKRFYAQGHGKTFVKFLLLNIIGFIMMILLLVIFFFLSIFQI